MTIYLAIVVFCILFVFLAAVVLGYLEKKSEAAELRNSHVHGVSATERSDGSDDPTIPFS